LEKRAKLEEGFLEDGDMLRSLRRNDKPEPSGLLKNVKSEKGTNPRKDGSLFGDKPHGALSNTLRCRAKGS
jgi:hypothetical protein